MSKEESLSFEEALRKLESIVGKLEESEVSLEESIELYEEGMKLAGYCSKVLEEAEQRIEKINADPEQGPEETAAGG